MQLIIRDLIYRSPLKKVAKKNKLPVIDLHSAMDGMPELFPDHIHPNEEGAKVMAKAVYDAIAK